MTIPKLNALQFLVLGVILPGEKSGYEIRSNLESYGETKEGPSFYQFMKRYEDSGYIEGRYTQKIVEGQIIRERLYKLTDSGRLAWEETRDFYRDVALAVDQQRFLEESQNTSWVNKAKAGQHLKKGKIGRDTS